MMDLSFVILTWNSERYIRNCLNALFQSLASSSFTYEIFIVDNGSHDGSGHIIDGYHKLHPEVIKPIYLDYNSGTTFSRNLALKKTIGRYIIIMDSDIDIPMGSIERLIEVHQVDNSIGLVVPKLIYPSGNLQISTDKFPTFFSKFMRFFFLKFMEKRISERPIQCGKRVVEYAISAFWVLKKETVNAVGLLDENIFYSPEDVDYCLRIWKAGYSIVQNQDAVVVHDAQEISRGFKINRATINHIKGLIYFFKKYHYVLNCPIEVNPKNIVIR